ncbi:uncharacterized protein LOC132558807 [Ylistrum balloti]|uniref:uncharacterized protein LOC132558807 n=1 Tax=Ylistrum balloti TaxID=509963 RepID=UPI002905DB55|nr:uncharacterized protein LOC132558807 [Ylistrum balloti]
MASVVCYIVFLVTLILGEISAVRFRYTGYRYSYYSTRYYYGGYRYYYSGYRYYYSGSTYGGRIAGIVIGCLIFTGIIIAVIVTACVLCRRRRTRGRLITPAVFSPNTTSVTMTAIPQGNASTLGAGPPLTTYTNNLADIIPNSQGTVTASTENSGEKSGQLPPSYDTVVGAPIATIPPNSGPPGYVSSQTDVASADRL